MTPQCKDTLSQSRRRSIGLYMPTGLIGAVSMMLVCGAGLATSTGCTAVSLWGYRGWVADYDSAEQRVHKTGRELLIAYVDPRPGKKGALKRVMDSAVVEARTGDYVRCRLFKSYEPDRRYVAQYGVERAPALIIVHANGTYHALQGPMSVERVSQFLADATGPGTEPVVNHQIPRRPRYEWHGDVTSAEEASKTSGKVILFVFYKRLSRDWRRLERILCRREVYRRFADMVHCRVDTLNPWAKTYVTKFGPVRLPALVIACGDGTHDVLEMPTSYESVVRFADRHRGSRATERVRSASAVAQP